MFSYADLIGVPFVDGGRDAKIGLDCYGLVMEIYRRNGIILPEYYAPALDSEAVSRQIEAAKASSNVWRLSDDKPFLSVMAIKFNCSLCNHTGVYLGGGRFIHTRERIGVNIDSVDSPAWKRRIAGFYVFEGAG